jgi:hypothetical protein
MVVFWLHVYVCMYTLYTVIILLFTQHNRDDTPQKKNLKKIWDHDTISLKSNGGVKVTWKHELQRRDWQTFLKYKDSQWEKEWYGRDLNVSCRCTIPEYCRNIHTGVFFLITFKAK